MNHDKKQSRWANLRYWQKGAILGARIILGMMLPLYLAVNLFVPTLPSPGEGDMAVPLLAWILAAVTWATELLPQSIRHLITGANFWTEPKLNIWMEILVVFLYPALFYAFLGIAISKAIQWLKT